jgi:hypothetical protein
MRWKTIERMFMLDLLKSRRTQAILAVRDGLAIGRKSHAGASASNFIIPSEPQCRHPHFAGCRASATLGASELHQREIRDAAWRNEDRPLAALGESGYFF